MATLPVTIYLFISQTAYNITLSASFFDSPLTICQSVYSLEFSHETIDQPVNVYHVFPNTFIVNHVDSVHLTPFIGDIVHELLPFPLNIILYVFSLTVGVTVTGVLGISNEVWAEFVVQTGSQLHPFHE